MITSIKDYNEINRIIRNVLLDVTGLPGTTILNAITLYGNDLQNSIDTQILRSIEHNNICIIFELTTNDTDSNVTITEDNDSISTFTSLNFIITIYGDDSYLTSQKIRAMLLTDFYRNKLYEQGINIEEISFPTKINEFINSSMWQRADLNIYLSCKIDITLTQDNEIYNSGEITYKQY